MVLHTKTERRSQSTPRRSAHHQFAPIDKGNNKQGASLKRPSTIRNSIGKQFHRTLCSHHVNKTAPQWSLGIIKGRRREESCLTVRLSMARCRRAKRSCAFNVRDAKAAFPSLEHSAIVQVFRKRVPAIASRVFEDLYGRATMTLKLCDGKWRVWRAGRGTRQGDSTGSDTFRAPWIDAVIAAKEMRRHRPHQTIQYKDRSIDPALVNFVDDIAELTTDEKTATLGEEALPSIEKQIGENPNTMVPALASIRCLLELCKEVVVPVWMGAGALVAAKRSRADGRHTSGTKAATARYLGDFINLSGIEHRILLRTQVYGDPETSAS